MKPDRIKRLLKAYLHWFFIHVICLYRDCFFVMSIREMITCFNNFFISTAIPPSCSILLKYTSLTFSVIFRPLCKDKELS